MVSLRVLRFALGTVPRRLPITVPILWLSSPAARPSGIVLVLFLIPVFVQLVLVLSPVLPVPPPLPLRLVHVTSSQVRAELFNQIRLVLRRLRLLSC